MQGSARFGIEPHEAPVSDFPKQPSRKDGLGVMCTEHWRAYVKGLREARKAAPVEAPAKRTAASGELAKAATQGERRRAPKAPVPDPKVVEAEALIAEIDALLGPAHVERIGDLDVQAALETIAAANGSARREALEAPIGEAVDGSESKANAA